MIELDLTLLEDHLCPVCEKSNAHPRYSDHYAEDVIYGPNQHEGLHKACFDEWVRFSAAEIMAMGIMGGEL
jgi:hypothetical protein